MAIEVTIISAEALTLNRRHISAKRNPFVTIHTDSNRSSAVTKSDTTGGSHPEWNQTLSLDTPKRSLVVEVRCDGGRVVGTAAIPAADFSGGYLPTEYLHFLSYRLRDERGEPNGIINLSVRAVVPLGSAAGLWSRPWTGVTTGVMI